MKIPAIEFELKPETKERVQLAQVPMPDDPRLREGERNVLFVSVTYFKNGSRGAGRGFYLSVVGCTLTGVGQSHDLMNDPNTRVLLAPAKRFSAKTLRELTASVPTERLDLIERLVKEAHTYYANKGRAA